MRLQKIVMVSVVLIACPSNCAQAATAATAATDSMGNHSINHTTKMGPQSLMVLRTGERGVEAVSSSGAPPTPLLYVATTPPTIFAAFEFSLAPGGTSQQAVSHKVPWIS
tara:strand:- start:1721 stop:2050 length:330 start_codon:yes stop_codon:yes gene_type:complete